MRKLTNGNKIKKKIIHSETSNTVQLHPIKLSVISVFKTFNSVVNIIFTVK